MPLINVNSLLLLRIDYKLMARPAMYEMARDNKVHGTMDVDINDLTQGPGSLFTGATSYGCRRNSHRCQRPAV